MSIRQVFVRERSAYTVSSFATKLSIDTTRANECIGALTARGILRWCSGSERDEFDEESTTNIAGKYQFVYVGLAVFEDLVIVVYPKYMDERRFTKGILEGVSQDDLQQLFHVLRKSAGSYSDIASLSEDACKFNDYIACVLMLMEMYDEYGIYSNYVHILTTNGLGEISWERTIAAHEAFVDDGTPLYFDLETIANTRDDTDFITRLHRCVLTECSNYMKATGLTTLLSLDEIELSDERIEDLGDKDYILSQLDMERNTQFVTWKQDVLDLLSRYINKDELDVHADEVICIGSTAFYSIWEKACKTAFDDLLGKRLSKIGIPLAGNWAQCDSETMLNIIPRPKWSQFINGEKQDCGDVATLIPDTIAIWDNNNEKVFVILDAKYYTPQLGTSPQGMPGVESVTKQVLYQRAYRNFVLDHGFSQVVNAFLLPYGGKDFKLMGHVDFPGVFDHVEPPFVDGVDMWLIPASRIWQCYLSEKRLTESELELFLNATHD